jgi:hypothetical protein
MEMHSLSAAWQIRLVMQALRIQAQIAYLDAQRQQKRVREERECARLQHAMPDAHAWTIDLTARLLVARDLDGGRS